MIKTYTFKIKLWNTESSNPIVATAIHCPLEVLHESIKATKEIQSLCEDCESSGVRCVVTASDYLADETYINSDYELAPLKVFLETKNLKELYVHPDFIGFQGE